MLNENELLLTQAKIGSSDAFEELFQKYVPIVLRQRSAYYLRDYDLDDWLQEGRIVCFQSLQRYNIKQDVTFGLFFKINFKRRIVTLLRHQEAQKRQIYHYTESLESKVDQLGEIFSKGVVDYRAGTSIDYIFIRESLEDFSEQLSKFEIKVYIYLLLGEGVESIANILNVSVVKVTSGYSRLRKKIKKQLMEE
ncbi:sigma-70 family RNA polymerase sigma factor [Vagococcus carniphilus]|uniref:RNA polymerase sigma factor SigS n=1 Tax=Vagococcus carniphilus TaxID=218144 RepID=A0A430B6H9_9ENTE|nr:sigma-70 family RNA polymerase sigma factor [Vagococcus carniphilus]QNN72818.1 sigma-70 family RNA polymerase sigma factor [Vagococcus carniphilus]RSU15924.1 hypothetical protein CBF28_05680 [Vagococcus carniphilus]